METNTKDDENAFLSLKKKFLNFRQRLIYEEIKRKKRTRIKVFGEKYSDDEDEDPKLLKSMSIGERRLHRIYEVLNEFDTKTTFKRSLQQMRFHNYFISASIRNIYTNDGFVKNYGSICKKYPQFEGIFNPYIIVCCPRRFGKTIAAAQYVCAYLLAVSECEIAIFSPSKRQSQFLLETTEKFLTLLGYDKFIAVRNQEKLFLKMPNESCLRRSSFYPSSVKTLRGVSAKCIILEEMAAIEPRLIFEVVLPLMQLSECHLISISTVQDEMNHLSKMIELKDENGDPFFRTFYFYGSCEPCRNKGEEAAFRCTHMDFLKPHWSSSGQMKKIKLLMESCNQIALANQELSGISNSTSKKAFDTNDVQWLFQKKNFHNITPPFIEYVFIGVDPSGGGCSDFGIVSSYFHDMQAVLVGFEAVPSKTIEDSYSALYAHTMELYNRFKNCGSTFVFVIENNLGHEAEHLYGFINKTFVNMDKLIMTKDDKIGLHTDHKFKVNASITIRNRLKYRSIRLHQEITTQSHNILTLFKEQLVDFRRIIKPAISPFSAEREIYSGKSSTTNDDLVMALLINVYWSEMFLLAKTDEEEKENSIKLI